MEEEDGSSCIKCGKELETCICHLLSEGIMLKTAQLYASYVIAVPHWRHILKKICHSKRFRKCYGRLLCFEKRIKKIVVKLPDLSQLTKISQV